MAQPPSPDTRSRFSNGSVLGRVPDPQQYCTPSIDGAISLREAFSSRCTTNRSARRPRTRGPRRKQNNTPGSGWVEIGIEPTEKPRPPSPRSARHPCAAGPRTTLMESLADGRRARIGGLDSIRDPGLVIPALATRRTPVRSRRARPRHVRGYRSSPIDTRRTRGSSTRDSMTLLVCTPGGTCI